MEEIFTDRLKMVDDILLKALRELFNEESKKHKPVISEEQNNNLLGEKYRAYSMAKEIIEQAFIGIESLKEIKKQDVTFHKER